MTIEPGMPWGRQVPRPDDLVSAQNDHDLARALTQRPGPPVAAVAGDLARTLGVSGNGRRDTINEFPIDLIEVRLDAQLGLPGEPLVACSHVIARSPLRRGHWWRGPILVVMNAEFIGDWDVAPRGHPNDGRAEVFEVDASMSRCTSADVDRDPCASSSDHHPIGPHRNLGFSSAARCDRRRMACWAGFVAGHHGATRCGDRARLRSPCSAHS